MSAELSDKRRAASRSGERPDGTELARIFQLLELRKRTSKVFKVSTFPESYNSGWHGLGPLGYEIVRYFQPKVVVELGTHHGLSALSMALAMPEGGRIFAVDTWQGDEHAGHYGNEVYDTFLKRCAELKLESVIVPLRMTFDEARDKVPTPIDLLHVDGLHTYEAVTHDFETYGPLVRPGGLIMFHDVNTHFEGVTRFWNSLTERYPHYMVPYSHGLGVIQV